MPLVEERPLSEDEFYAGLVLTDPLLFRLYFFNEELKKPPSREQKLMFCDESKRVLLCTGRKIAKTIHLEAYVLQKGLLHKSQSIVEALFFTPSDVHMIPDMDRIYGRVDNTPLLKSVVRVERKGDSPILEFCGNLRWYFRIEGLSGKDTNMVGIRALFIVGDECAFGNWACHISRIQTALPECDWMYAGVPNGVRTTPFYALDQQPEGGNWSRHKYSTYANPIYQSEEAKKRLISDYEGEDTQGYTTQVLGQWGEELISSFPPGSIAVAPPDTPYFVKELRAMRAEVDLPNLSLAVGVPSIRCYQFALGWDYGFSPDPSVVIAAFRKNEEDVWQTYCRIVMRRVALPHQIEVVRHLIHHVLVGTFIGLSCDNISAVQMLQSKDPKIQTLYLWANPGGSTEMPVSKADYDPAAEKIPTLGNKELYTTLFRSWMTNAMVNVEGTKLWLGPDREVTDELINTTEAKTERGRTVYYGPRDPNNRNIVLDHNTDAHRYLTHPIYMNASGHKLDQSKEELLAELGWTGAAPNRTWRAPWER